MQKRPNSSCDVLGCTATIRAYARRTALMATGSIHRSAGISGSALPRRFPPRPRSLRDLGLRAFRGDVPRPLLPSSHPQERNATVRWKSDARLGAGGRRVAPDTERPPRAPSASRLWSRSRSRLWSHRSTPRRTGTRRGAAAWEAARAGAGGWRKVPVTDRPPRTSPESHRPSAGRSSGWPMAMRTSWSGGVVMAGDRTTDPGPRHRLVRCEVALQGSAEGGPTRASVSRVWLTPSIQETSG